MKKRSAILIAASVVAAMFAGAISLSASGSTTAEAQTAAPDPQVRTVHRTVTIHRTASPASDEGRTSTPAPAVVTTAPSSDDAFDDADDDDAFEDESEDQSGPSENSGSSSDEGHSDDD